jgi:hypothetical protein
MPTKITLTDDLREFKIDLLNELRKMVKEHNDQPVKEWLISNEVCNLLDISSVTLQNWRDNGTLPYTIIGGVISYNYQDIKNILTDNQTNSDFHPDPLS